MKICHPFAILLAAGASAFATPTGINNIPTADITPNRTVVFQGFSSFGNGVNQFSANGPGQQSFWLGFKAGFEFAPLQLELGLDSPLASGSSGPLLFQTKVGLTPWKGGRVALGIANVALTDTGRWSDPFGYVMLSHDFGVVRLHGGYGLQTNGNTALIGVDRTFKVFHRNLNLNADLVQTGNQTGCITAIGLKYDLSKHIVFEGWSNIPDTGTASFVAKINFVFKF